MGAKGKKRREKNYRAAHGGGSRLPPPPNAASLDAIPSKLRKLMSYTASASGGDRVNASSESAEKSRRNNGTAMDKTHNSKDVDSKVTLNKGKGRDANSMAQHIGHASGAPLNVKNDNKKKKRKRGKVNDLRFEAIDGVGGSGSKRKERKKQRLEERKKKHKRGRADEEADFPGREEIKFGEVVEAPPKLVVAPKLFKNTQYASLERLRLQAVEDYRNRKGWASRPGLQLAPPVTESLMS